MRQPLRRASVLSAILGAELCWLWTVMRVIGEAVPSGGGSFPAAWLLAVLPISSALLLLLRRWIRPQSEKAGLVRARLRAFLPYAVWAVLGGLLLAVIALTGEALTGDQQQHLFLPAGAVLWALGFRLAAIAVDRRSAVMELQLSILVLLATLATARGFRIEVAGLEAGAVLSVILGLAATALTNERGPLGSLGAGRWWAVLLVSLAAVLGVAFAVTVIATPDLLRALGRVAGWTWARIDWVLARISSILPEPGGSSATGMTAPGGAALPGEDSGSVLPDWLLHAVRLAFSIFLVACTLAVVWLLSRRLFSFARRRPGADATQIESLSGGLRRDLASLWRRIAQMFLRLLGRSATKAARAETIVDDPDIASVRRLYRLLLERGAERGVARRVSDTPGEYRLALGTKLAEGMPAVDLLTDAYVEARYGARAPSAQELHKLERAWKHFEDSV